MDYKLGSEYRDVALRRQHLESSTRSAEEVLQVIESLEDAAESVIVTFKPRPLSPDPNDDMILDLAINGHAEVIITQNSKHFLLAAKRFDIAVMSPGELLGHLRNVE